MNKTGADMDDNQASKVADALSKVGYNPRTMKTATQCSICMEDYKKGEQVTALKCNNDHVFHTDCIVRWVKERHNTCPLCRKPIENLESLRSMMEGGETESLLPKSKMDEQD